MNSAGNVSAINRQHSGKISLHSKFDQFRDNNMVENGNPSKVKEIEKI
jgi:hypothetical protein